MQAAVIDDSEDSVALLKEYLSKFSKESKIPVSVSCFSDAKAFFDAFVGQFSLVILDIDMPGMNGIDAARLLRQKDRDVLIMFVTNMPQYALEGYEVEAVDYILKPVSYPDFALKLHKAMRYLKRDQEERLLLHTTSGDRSISQREILYVESELHYVVYHTFDGNYRVRSTLTKAEAALSSGSFARCNNSCLVNLRHVSAIQKDDVRVGVELLKISRSHRNAFLEQFTRYLGGI